MNKLALSSLDQNFVEVVSLLNQQEVPYWVCHGTLLGLVREGQLIPWDHDIDFAVWSGAVSKQSIIELMKGCGYFLKNDGGKYDFLQFRKDGGRDVDFNFYRIGSDQNMAYSEWFIARSKFMSLLGALSDKTSYHRRWGWLIGYFDFFSEVFAVLVAGLKKIGLYYKSAGYTTPASMLKESDFLEVSGLSVRVPKKHSEVLEFIYGKNWRVPIQRYDWTKDSPATRISTSRFEDKDNA